MKANAPEKLYLSKNIYGTYIYQVPDPDDETVVEYTRADAFIEKACDWFRMIDYDDSMPPFETTEGFIEGFKKAMML